MATGCPVVHVQGTLLWMSFLAVWHVEVSGVLLGASTTYSDHFSPYDTWVALPRPHQQYTMLPLHMGGTRPGTAASPTAMDLMEPVLLNRQSVSRQPSPAGRRSPTAAAAPVAEVHPNHLANSTASKEQSFNSDWAGRSLGSHGALFASSRCRSAGSACVATSSSRSPSPPSHSRSPLGHVRLQQEAKEQQDSMQPEALQVHSTGAAERSGHKQIVGRSDEADQIATVCRRQEQQQQGICEEGGHQQEGMGQIGHGLLAQSHDQHKGVASQQQGLQLVFARQQQKAQEPEMEGAQVSSVFDKFGRFPSRRNSGLMAKNAGGLKKQQQHQKQHNTGAWGPSAQARSRANKEVPAEGVALAVDGEGGVVLAMVEATAEAADLAGVEAIAAADAEVCRIMQQPIASPQGAEKAPSVWEGSLFKGPLHARCETAPHVTGASGRGAAAGAAAYGRLLGWVCHSAAAVRGADGVSTDAVAGGVGGVVVIGVNSCTENHKAHSITQHLSLGHQERGGGARKGDPVGHQEKLHQQMRHRQRSRAPLSRDAAQKAVVKPPASAEMVNYSASRRHTLVSVAGRHCASGRMVLDTVHMTPTAAAAAGREAASPAAGAGCGTPEGSQPRAGQGVQPLSSPRVLVLPPKAHGSRFTSLSAPHARDHQHQKHLPQQQRHGQQGGSCQSSCGLEAAGALATSAAAAVGCPRVGRLCSGSDNNIRGCVLMQFGPPKPHVSLLPAAAAGAVAADLAAAEEWLISGSNGNMSALQFFGTPRLLPVDKQRVTTNSSSSGQRTSNISSNSGYGVPSSIPSITGWSAGGQSAGAEAAAAQHSLQRHHMKKSRPSKVEPHGPQDIDPSAPYLNGRKLSSPVLEDINYIVGRWSSR